ncbi:hypothetical protein D1871_14145 [Nakamurella silvestris]|nr:hypothetical protein D1871_14145 [Nakamurella silvestris]
MVIALAVTVAAAVGVGAHVAARADDLQVAVAVPEALRAADGSYRGTASEDALERVVDGLVELTVPYENYGGISYQRATMSLQLWVRSSEWPAATAQAIHDITRYAKAIGMDVVFHEIVHSEAELVPLAEKIVQAAHARGWVVEFEQRGQNEFAISWPEMNDEPEIEDAMFEIAREFLGDQVAIALNPDG